MRICLVIAIQVYFLNVLFLFFLFRIGTAVLVLTATEVDKTGASYYGEQGLHYLSTKGEGNIVLLSKQHILATLCSHNWFTHLPAHIGKKGPVYEVEWSPDSNEFCVVYGCILKPSPTFLSRATYIY